MDYHEFVQGELKKPLQPGKYYQVSCWVYQDDSTAVHHLKGVFGAKSTVVPLAANNLGFSFFVKAEVDISDPQPTYFEKEYSWINRRRPQVVFKKILKTNGRWQQMSAIFLADQAYTHFIIGNFFADAETSVSPKEISDRIDKINNQKRLFMKPKRIAYYWLDDISVGLATGPPTLAEELSYNEVYVFKNLLFETNKSTLLPGASAELDLLADWLKINAAKNIEIGGHTDNVGEPAANLLLSTQRAKSVYQYLVSKGINSKRLSFKGYGETKPRSSNDTEEGRRENRRVECLMLEESN